MYDNFLVNLECLWYVFDQYLLTEAMVFEKCLWCFFLKNKGMNYKIKYKSLKTGCKTKICRKGINK